MSGFELLFGAAAAGGAGGFGSAFTALSAVATLAGTAMSAMGTIAAGKAQEQQAQMVAKQKEFEADQIEARGKWEQAQQRNRADMAKRQKTFAKSRARNVGSQGGFVGGDHTSALNIANIERWGSFDELNELAGGMAARREGEMGAYGARYEGAMSKAMAPTYSKSAMMQAGGTIMGGISSLASMYNPKPPAQTTGWGATVKRAGPSGGPSGGFVSYYG